MEFFDDTRTQSEGGSPHITQKSHRPGDLVSINILQTQKVATLVSYFY